ncbi:hypothetical protein J4E89_001032 [Alternaria sp. Ai002NY15]|nr:hypothetical protein J4E89_001032 [Alternaria sp. Ai002NY15]
MAQSAPEPPQMTLIYHMEALLGDRFSLGSIPTGQERIVIPIVGGTFKGPRISGKVLNLGADWRLTDAQGAFRPDARYNIQTDDGTFIYVQTIGLPPAADGAPTMLRGQFETDTNGTAAWLNDVAAVGVLRRNGTSSVIIDMWQILPADLIELQIGQVELLLAMYPDEITLDENSQGILDILRDTDDARSRSAAKYTPVIPVILDLPVSTPNEESPNSRTLRLDIGVPFAFRGDKPPLDPPTVKVRVQQPQWMNKAATSRLTSDIPEDEDLLSKIEYIREAAVEYLTEIETTELGPDLTAVDAGPLVRVWFYFPSISTRSKRDDFIKFAPSYQLTGFLYAGKPGLLCVEGGSQNIDDYMKYIKTESWGDIPAHHKKVSERHREQCEKRVFPDMTEITDTVGERRGQRANRGDMKAIEEWLVERGLGDAFTKVLM